MEAIISLPGEIPFGDEEEKKLLMQLFQGVGVNPTITINGLGIGVPKEIHVLYPEHSNKRKKVKDNTHALIEHLKKTVGIKVKFKETNSFTSSVYVNNPHHY